jgi:hypothetical protein
VHAGNCAACQRIRRTSAAFEAAGTEYGAYRCFNDAGGKDTKIGACRPWLGAHYLLHSLLALPWHVNKEALLPSRGEGMLNQHIAMHQQCQIGLPMRFT